MTAIFTREDWKLFRNIETLGQKAGVRREYLPRLVVKEVVDNALDACGVCQLGLLPDQNGFYVQDSGAGMDPERLAALFSINRPLMSSKLLRLPTRGALGNGLRVVVGAVMATGGQLFVSTHKARYKIHPREDGTSDAHHVGEYDGLGTRVEVILGSALRITEDDLSWGKWAVACAQGEESYGKTSPFWYTSESFYEVVNAFGGQVSDLLPYFDGISKKRAAEILQVTGNGPTALMVFDEADALLGLLRDENEPVGHKKLGGIGEALKLTNYVKRDGTFSVRSARGRHHAEIPYVVEVWSKVSEKSNVVPLVNRTHITGTIDVYDDRNKILLYGCGLSHSVRCKAASIVLNIQTPYMPITSDGKEPNLHPMLGTIADAFQKSTRKAKRQDAQERNAGAHNEKEVILRSLGKAIAKASGGGQYRFSQRQLYYAVRPYVIAGLDKEPDYNYFCRILTEYEATHGDIPKLYRDPRGILYHPHLGDEIPLGTLAVEAYQRPRWTFNKVLYSEKEGFFQILRDAKFPERFDCALMTSKGFASRAVRDLFDLLGETSEEITFYCIHDADAAGTTIYETLQEGTMARPGRKFKVINLGLDPWNALAMDLEVERVESKTRRPVAAYIKEKWDRDWENWLQSNRVELNAMTSPQFLEWLEEQMTRHGGAPKVIPTDEVMQAQLQQAVRTQMAEKVRNRILAAANYEEQVKQALDALQPSLSANADGLQEVVRDELMQCRELHWTRPISELAQRITSA